MTFDPNSPRLRLGIVGCGAMGRGIAQIAAAAGLEVLLCDSRDGAAEEAHAFVVQMLERAVAKGRLQQPALERARLRVVPGLEALADCDLVVEAIVEQLEAKQALFTRLEGLVRDACVLATNTSSLSVTVIGAGCRRPQRLIGFHFFNPVPLMKLVEVVPGVRTDPAVVEAMLGLGWRLGHVAVRASDTPGFLVNHAGRGFGTEAGRILSEGIADFHDIDRLMTDSAGFRLGPFELMDLIGLDVTQAVMESIHDQFYQEPRFRPSLITRQLRDGGLLGRKSGQGFYRYDDGQQQTLPETPVPELASLPARPVWISARHPEASAPLRALLKRTGARQESGARPSAQALCLVTPLCRDCTGAVLDEQLDPARTLAVDTLLGLEGRRTLMLNPATAPEYRQLAQALLAQDGVPVTLINDSPGFVAPRILAVIVNIACEIAQQRIAAPADIDRAVELGLGYPQGPLALGDRLGAARLLDLLEGLHRFYGDPRYRPSAWLQRRARLGLSLKTEESRHA
ncbi:3-hydroxyacyl-CoA dehydrogenase [Marinobacterium aestuariivivens]|uniref:3-hydroxyacyl-CoA dehydrogenase n=1 Tax=Marinobacterium aestuariivivens TaxID=1698799 RepID=A0ABW2A2E9_9GAMM